MAFAQKLKRIRKNKNLSQQDLADKLGIAQSTVGMWEAGRRTPKLDEVERIAGTLGMKIMDLIGGKQAICLEGLNKIDIKKIKDYIYAVKAKKAERKR